MGVLVQIREKGICRNIGKNLGDIDPGAVGQEPGIHLLAADDKGVTVSQGQQLLRGVDGFRPVRGEAFLPGQRTRLRRSGRPRPPGSVSRVLRPMTTV